MDITKYFINFCKASGYVYCGENEIEIYKRVDGKFKKTKSFENKTLFNIDNYTIDEMKRELGGADTGVVLNSGYFIFNIFEFDKIPFREEKRKDLITWRLQKVFPEDIEQYDHDFFKIEKKRILSVLFKKSLREKIETVFNDNGMKLIYIGNSTVEIINNFRKSKKSPDFFVEIDNNLSIVVFLSHGVPFYIRKFRSNKESDIAQEIVKTVNFVKSSHENVPCTYSIIANSADSTFSQVKERLIESQIKELHIEHKKKIFLPE